MHTHYAAHVGVETNLLILKCAVRTCIKLYLNNVQRTVLNASSERGKKVIKYELVFLLLLKDISVALGQSM